MTAIPVEVQDIQDINGAYTVYVVIAYGALMNVTVLSSKSPKYSSSVEPYVYFQTGLDVADIFLIGDALRDHPNFRDACRRVVKNLIDHCCAERIRIRLQMEDGRYVCFLAILGLNAIETADDRAAWLTLGRLQDYAATLDVASPNRVAAIVALLERYGFVTRQLLENDRRVYRISPTDRMLRTDRELLSVFFAALAQLREDGGLDFHTDRFDGNARLFNRLRHETLGLMMPIRRRSPDFYALMQRDSGLVVLLMALHEANERQSAVIELRYDEVARRSGISRTQARLLLEDCHRRGLLTLNAKGGRQVTVQPKLTKAFDEYLSNTLAHLALLGERARRWNAPARRILA